MNQREDFERFLNESLVFSRRMLVPAVFEMPVGAATWNMLRAQTSGNSSRLTDLVTLTLFRAAWMIVGAQGNYAALSDPALHVEHGPLKVVGVESVEALYLFLRGASRLTGDLSVPEQERYLRALHLGAVNVLRY